MITQAKHKENFMAQLDNAKYLYEKTGLFQYLEDYFKASSELIRIGVKPEEMCLLKMRTK